MTGETSGAGRKVKRERSRNQRDREGRPQVEGATWDDVDAAIAESLDQEQKLAPHYRGTRLEDGAVIDCQFVRAEEGCVNKAMKWFTWFKIVNTNDANDARMIGMPIIRTYNKPRPGWISPRHNVSIDWAAVTGLPPRPIPNRSSNAVLGAFLRSCVIEARTHLVTGYNDQRERRWVERPESDHYSVIDKLVRVVAGTPRVLQMRRVR